MALVCMGEENSTFLHLTALLYLQFEKGCSALTPKESSTKRENSFSKYKQMDAVRDWDLFCALVGVLWEGGGEEEQKKFA